MSSDTDKIFCSLCNTRSKAFVNGDGKVTIICTLCGNEYTIKDFDSVLQECVSKVFTNEMDEFVKFDLIGKKRPISSTQSVRIGKSGFYIDLEVEF